MCKKLIHLFSFVLMVSQACNAVEVARWDFEETSGTTATDNSGQYVATLQGSASLNVEGKFGSGLQIGGVGGGMLIDAADSGAFRLDGDFSIALWAKSDVAFGNYTRFVDMAAADGGLADSYRLMTGNAANEDNFRFMSRQDGSNTDNIHTRDLVAGTWLLLVVRHDLDGDVTLNVLQDGDNVDPAFVAANSESWPTAGPIVYAEGDLKFGRQNNGNNPVEGQMDGIAFYDEVLTDEQVADMFYSVAGSEYPLAAGPDPADGAVLEATWANLGWRAGDYAVSHDFYFGTSFDDVNDGAEGTFAGNVATTSQVVGFAGFPAPDGLQPGTTYYWRVDEVNDANVASPWKGDVWSFSIPSQTAYDNSPADGASNVLQDATLSWTPGMGASLHHVYFGESLDEVSNAAGALPLVDAVFTPTALETAKTYYWRVDEFDSTGATHRGDVWSFTTVPEVAVTNPNLTLWWTLDAGEGAVAAVDKSGHGNHGAIVGDALWTDGYQGAALTFGQDVYVEAAGYPGVTGTAPRTCCAWIRATSTGDRNIMTWGQNVATQKWRMRIDPTGGLRIEVNGGSHIGVTNIADGLWHHVAVTFEDDGTPDVLDTLLYVDGQLDATAASTDEPVDTAGDGVVRIGESPWHNQPFDGVIDDARIYDVVLTAEEIQQVMRGNTKLAGNPDPDSHAIMDIRDIASLSWSAGDAASSHNVYFGTDRDAVAGADSNSPEFQGNQAGTSLPLAGLVEFGGGDYYWRVDEVAADGTVTAGTIWKFTVPDNLIVEDFESYNEIEEGEPGSNRIYLTWIDGFGTTTNGAIAGNLEVPFMSPGRSGVQAMPLSYDNAGKTSEATRALVPNKDWTEHGVTKLVVWFSGDSANAAERMFVALGNAIVYHPDDAATQDGGWNEWVIDLQEFANQGADLANVASITIGFGTRNAPVATGGTGTVDIDDIGLIQ
ncbi:MAG: LamG domain-containing protein [Planctomycetota bacterium]|jgi:hypothetical protein